MLNENEVIERLTPWLLRNGWRIDNVAFATEQGVDVEASTSNGCRLLIEAKGETPAKGKNAGKGIRQTNGQHRQNIEAGLFKLFSLIQENMNDKLVRCGLALPDNPIYRALIENRISEPFKNVPLVCFFISEDGSINTYPEWWSKKLLRFPFFGSHELPDPREWVYPGELDERDRFSQNATRPHAGMFKIILMEVLEEAAQENWCNDLFCSTCGGGREIRDALVRKIGYPLDYCTTPRVADDPFLRISDVPVGLHHQFQVNVIRGLRLLDPEFVFSDERRKSILENEHDVGIILAEIDLGPYTYVKAGAAIRPIFENSWVEYLFEYWKGVYEGTEPPRELFGPHRDWQSRLAELWNKRV